MENDYKRDLPEVISLKKKKIALETRLSVETEVKRYSIENITSNFGCLQNKDILMVLVFSEPEIAS